MRLLKNLVEYVPYLAIFYWVGIGFLPILWGWFICGIITHLFLQDFYASTDWEEIAESVGYVLSPEFIRWFFSYLLSFILWPLTFGARIYADISIVYDFVRDI